MPYFIEKRRFFVELRRMDVIARRIEPDRRRLEGQLDASGVATKSGRCWMSFRVDGGAFGRSDASMLGASRRCRTLTIDNGAHRV